MVKPIHSQITTTPSIHTHPKPRHSGYSPEHSTPPIKRSKNHLGTFPSHSNHHKTPLMHKSDLEMPRKTTDRQLIDLIIRYGNHTEGPPALLSAVKNQDYDAVRTFLKNGADLTVRDANGLTPLQYFIEKSFLGGWGGWIPPEDKTNKLCHYLDLLLDAGADIHEKTADGRNILQLTWNEEVRDFLISRGAVE